MEELAIKIEHVSKQYRLGAIGGGTLQADLQSWWARKTGKEDPNSKIGARTDVKIGERFLALDDINLEVKKGEAVGIIGHNGAGKSTLLKLLSRVTAPTTGKISIDGRIASMLEVGTGFHPELTGRENIYMNGAILGMTRAEIDRKIDQIIEFSEVEQFIDTPVKRYSSGMYVKLAFSVAAHLDSEIMIMDEVLAVGDAKFQQKCLKRMSEAANSEGRTVLYVSHNMNTIRQLCNRCIVLNQGKIIFDGDTEKAISIYLDSNEDHFLKKIYDISNRPTWLIEDKFRVMSAQYTNRDSIVFSTSEKIVIQFEYIYKTKYYDNIGLRLEVLNKSGIAIGTAIIFNLPLGITDTPKNFSIEFELDGIVSGEYKTNYTFFTRLDLGARRDVDWVPGLQLIIKENNNDDYINWNASKWGYIRFPTPIVE